MLEVREGVLVSGGQMQSCIVLYYEGQSVAMCGEVTIRSARHPKHASSHRPSPASAAPYFWAGVAQECRS